MEFVAQIKERHDKLIKKIQSFVVFRIIIFVVLQFIGSKPHPFPNEAINLLGIFLCYGLRRTRESSGKMLIRSCDENSVNIVQGK